MYVRQGTYSPSPFRFYVVNEDAIIKAIEIAYTCRQRSNIIPVGDPDLIRSPSKINYLRAALNEAYLAGAVVIFSRNDLAALDETSRNDGLILLLWLGFTAARHRHTRGWAP